MHDPVETIVDKLEEKIVAEEESVGIFRFLGWALVLALVVFAGITLFNMSRGKSLAEAMPCGGSCIARLFDMAGGKSVPAAEATPTGVDPQATGMREMSTSVRKGGKSAEDAGQKYGSLG